MATEPPATAPAAPDALDSQLPGTARQAVAHPDAVQATAAADPLHPGLVRARVVLAFLIGGPPLGTFLVAAPLLLFGLDGGQAPGNALGLALLMALFSYVFGAAPALLTGMIAAWYWPQLRGWRAHARIGMAGFLLSLTCLGIAFAVLEAPRDSIADAVAMLLLCSLPGFVGATLVSRLLQALR